jgi:hypothetical protein
MSEFKIQSQHPWKMFKSDGTPRTPDQSQHPWKMFDKKGRRIEQNRLMTHSPGQSTQPQGYANFLGAMGEIMQGLAMGGVDELAQSGSMPYAPTGGGPLAALTQKAELESRNVNVESPTAEEARKGYLETIQDPFREENPILAFGLNVAGSMAAPAGLANMARAKLGKKAGMAVLPIASGAGGGATSALEAEPGKRLENVTSSALISAGTMGAFQALKPLASRVAGTFANTTLDAIGLAVQKSSSPDTAAEMILRSLGDRREDFGLTADDLIRLKKRLKQGSGKTFGAAEDAGLLQLARYISERGGGKELAAKIQKLARKSGKRLRKMLANKFLRGKKGGIKAAQEYRKDIIESRSKVASAQYRESFKQAIEPTQELRNIYAQLRLQDGSTIEEINKLGNNALFAETGKPSNWKLSAGITPSTQGWHAIAKALGELGKPGKEGSHAYRQMRRTILDEIDKQNLDYAAARAHWRGAEESRELMDFGREIAKGMDEGTMAERLRQLKEKHGRSLNFKHNSADKELVTLGLTEGLEQAVLRKSGASVPDAAELVGRSGPGTAQSVFDKDVLEKNIRTILGDDATDDIYIRVVQEMNIKHAANTLSHATGTSKQKAVESSLRSNFFGDLKSGLFNADPKTLASLQKMLLSTNPDDQDRLLRVLGQKTMRNRLKEVGKYIPKVLDNPFAVGRAVADAEPAQLWEEY